MSADGVTLDHLLGSAVGRFPERPLLRWMAAGRRHELTQAAAWEQVGRMARGLLRAGFAPGERCFVVRNDSPHAPLLCLAVLRLGGVLTSFLLPTPAEMRRLVEAMAPRWIAAPSPAAAAPFGLTDELVESVGARWITLDAGEDPVEAGTALRVEALAAEDRPDARALPSEPDSNTLGAIFCTSGTTGPAKAVRVSRRALLAPIYAHRQRAPGQWETYLLDRPFNNRTAFRLFLDCWINGNCFGLFDGARSVDDNLRALGATIAVLSPSYYIRKRDEMTGGRAEAGRDRASTAIRRYLSDQVRGLRPPRGAALAARLALPGRLRRLRRHLPPLNTAISNSAPLPAEVADFFAGHGLLICDVYGSTECGPIAGNVGSAWRAGAVGKPMERVLVKLADDGEVLARSPFTMNGYFGDEARTAATLRDGWIATGDVGRFDDDGYLVLQGRKSPLIVHASGHKVDPARVEAVLAGHAAVRGAFVFGDGEDALVAVVHRTEAAPAGLEDELRAALAGLGSHMQVRAFGMVADAPAPTREEAARRHGPLIAELAARARAAGGGRFGA